MESRRKTFLNYFQYHWDFINYDANAFINCFEILILTYSDSGVECPATALALVSAETNKMK